MWRQSQVSQVYQSAEINDIEDIMEKLIHKILNGETKIKYF